MSTKAQISLLATWIPLALIWLGWTFKNGWIKDTLFGTAILLTTVGTIIWFRLLKRRRL